MGRGCAEKILWWRTLPLDERRLPRRAAHPSNHVTPLSATEKKEVVASGGTELFKFFKKLVKHDARNAVPSPDLTQNLNSLYPMLSQHCIDCDKSIDMEMERGWGMWGSVNNGCFFCMNCSGRHRSIGVHLRFALLACPVGSDCVCTQLRPLHSAR